MNELDKVLEAYRDTFGVKTDRANETHREACIEVASLRERAEKAEAFIREIFNLSDWPEGGDIDGFELQDAAVKHGYLVPEIRKEPCGEGCSCATYYSSDEWEDGVTCYRLSALLVKAKK